MVKTAAVAYTWARQIVSHTTSAEDSPAAFLTDAASTLARLRAGLGVFFGQAGFDALWGRALALASQSLAGDDRTDVTARMLHTSDWADALCGWTLDEVHSFVIAAFTSFIDVLFTLVGVELGTRLLSQIWPELPLDTSDTPTGDVTG